MVSIAGEVFVTLALGLSSLTLIIDFGFVDLILLQSISQLQGPGKRRRHTDTDLLQLAWPANSFGEQDLQQHSASVLDVEDDDGHHRDDDDDDDE